MLSFPLCSRFAFVKHVHSAISDKYEEEFVFGYQQLVSPLKTEDKTIIMTVEESAGLVVRVTAQWTVPCLQLTIEHACRSGNRTKSLQGIKSLQGW